MAPGGRPTGEPRILAVYLNRTIFLALGKEHRNGLLKFLENYYKKGISYKISSTPLSPRLPILKYCPGQAPETAP